MHTARQLDRSLFAVRIDGHDVRREDLLLDWCPLDRLGVVVHEPFGAVGASHLIQLAITAFYDAAPGRRGGRPREGDRLAVYPEIYLFHVGGRHGDHSHLDIWPARKDVFLESDPRAVLAAINDRGITRLAVPDGDLAQVEHEWKEPAAARDRISSAFIYGPGGRIPDANVEIEGLSARTEFNVEKILSRDGPADDTSVTRRRPEKDPGDSRTRDWEERTLARLGEAGGGLDLARSRRARIRIDGRTTEHYRSTSVDVALDMLVQLP